MIFILNYNSIQLDFDFREKLFDFIAEILIT